MSVIKSSVVLAAVAALCFSVSAQASKKIDPANHRALLNFKSCAKPEYPKESLTAKHEGTVTLAFLVDTSGAVLETKVEKSSGHVPLDTAAADALKLCKFDPALKNSKPAQEWTKVQYVWTLK